MVIFGRVRKGTLGSIGSPSLGAPKVGEGDTEKASSAR